MTKHYADPAKRSASEAGRRHPGGTVRDRRHAERTIAAEARAVEEGHRAFIDRDERGPFIRVISDTVSGKWYRVVAHAAAGRPIVFECEPRGVRAFGDDHKHATTEPGGLPCKHAALAVRRLEREGLAVFRDGAWYATTWAEVRATVRRLPSAPPANPFEGFPR